jgi:hypothetical protein
VLIGTDLVRAAALAVITGAAAMHLLTFGVLLAAAAVLGVMRVVFEIGFQTYLPSIVPREDLVQGNSTVEAIRASGQIVGPGVGGWLVQLVGAANALSNLLFTAVTALTVLFLVDTVGVSPGTAGLIFSIGSAAALLAAAVATKLARSLGSARMSAGRTPAASRTAMFRMIAGGW